MADEQNRGGLPAMPGLGPISAPAEHHAAHSPGFTFNLAGVPIPLRRTFAAIDRLFAIPIEVAGDALEKKMKGNLDRHVENVQRTRRKKGKKESVENPSPRTTRAITEWARRAAETDAEEPTLSSLWEALLDAIMDDEADGERLLSVVKASQPGDICFFLAKFARAPGRRIGEAAQWSRLENLGLVKRWLSSYNVITLCIILSVGLYAINDLAPHRIIGMPALSKTAEFFRTIADYGIPIGGLFAIAFFIMFVMHEPTKLGRELCARYLKYKRERDS
ncbi:hypothetical protein ACQR16_10145 [Bradyrhizobium oligotrophicum]|uniref:hypothetical protein n=1 Tax=Bradyrhizobium oligotrophicum TaxID=44255 RepID=UPI003EB934EE